MASNPGAWEGLGGPVNLDRYHLEGIDPALDDCCRREVESNRKYNALTSTLNRHDITVLAERRKRHVLHNLKFGSGCRCSYDPDADGGEYRCLIEMREEFNHEKAAGEDEEQDDPKEQEREDSDSDDEFDYLLDEDLPVDSDLEERRRAELEYAMLEQEIALHHGYGAHRQMHPNRVLRGAGLGGARAPPSTVVLHLFDPDSTVSASLDLYLEKLAATYKGTKFMRAGGRSTLLMDTNYAAASLPNLKADTDMPALIAIRNGDVIAVCPRLHGLADEDRIIDHEVRDWLDHANVLVERPPPLDQLCRIRPEEDALLDHMRASNLPPEPRYNCGVPTCNKPFPHEHVGIQNQQQDGLVLPEDTVVDNENATNVQF